MCETENANTLRIHVYVFSKLFTPTEGGGGSTNPGNSSCSKWRSVLLPAPDGPNKQQEHSGCGKGVCWLIYGQVNQTCQYDGPELGVFLGGGRGGRHGVADGGGSGGRGGGGKVP